MRFLQLRSYLRLVFEHKYKKGEGLEAKETMHSKYITSSHKYDSAYGESYVLNGENLNALINRFKICVIADMVIWNFLKGSPLSVLCNSQQ